MSTNEGHRILRRAVYFAPIVIALVILVAFGLGLGRNSRVLPSALLDKPVPAFELPPLFADFDVPGFGDADLKDGVTVVNVFASWCIPCLAEHPLITRLSKLDGVRVYGLNYKDQPDDAKAWLRRQGNPYTAVGSDIAGRVAIDWGVTGLPETYVIDARGIIRYKYVGPLNPNDFEKMLLPVIYRLRDETRPSGSDG